MTVLTSLVLLLVSGFFMRCGDSDPVSGGGQSVGRPWYQQNPYPTSNNLFGVQYISDNRAWVVAEGGVLLLTVDGARTWKESTRFSATAYDLSFVDTKTGWVVGEQGMIMHTDDGGRSWKAQHSGTDACLLRVTFVDDQHGWTVGRSGTILATRDGGRSWQSQGDGSAYLLCDIRFIDEDEGWAVGASNNYENGAELLHTDDGGEHWTHVDAGIPTDLGHPDSHVTARLYSIAFSGRRTITIVGSADQWALMGGIRLHSQDGGDTWEVELTGTSCQSVCYATDKLGWIACSAGIIYKTSDAGATWERQDTPGGYGLISIDFANSEVGCAVGSIGTVLRTDNGGDTWEEITRGNRSPVEDIQFADSLNGWVAGYGGLLRTTNGGFTWEQTDCTANQALCFLDADEGWACDYMGNLSKTADGGLTWTPVHDAIESRVYDMVFLDSLHGWVSGMPAILGTDDGGYSWTVQWPRGNNGTRLFGLSFVDLNHGWVVGENGTILLTSGGGSSWRLQTCPTTANLRDVCFIDTLRGWAVGRTSMILATTDGGEHWRVQTDSPDTEFGGLSAVMFADSLNGWATGSNGVIVATDNGGHSWNLQSTKVSSSLSALWALDDKSIWAAGWGGTILHTSNGGW